MIWIIKTKIITKVKCIWIIIYIYIDIGRPKYLTIKAKLIFYKLDNSKSM